MSRYFIWRDLTVKDAKEVKHFYEQVFNWQPKEHDMGDYVDFDMIDPNTNDTIAGICHQRKTNKNIPSQWLNYCEVDSVQETIERCQKFGGSLIDGPRKMGEGWFAVIKDPAGAIMGIISK